MSQPIKHWIIEGIDRLGKSSLINGIMHNYGAHLYVHYEAPKKLAYYQNRSGYPATYDLRQVQKDGFDDGFKLLETDARTVFDRFHLGEYVYAPMYRDYPGDYVFDECESQYTVQWPEDPSTKKIAGKIANNTRMILLTTSDFSFVEDDGGNFDFNRKEEEQERFKEAFNKSYFQNKVMIDVADGKGGFRPFRDILVEATGDNNVVCPHVADYIAEHGYPESHGTLSRNEHFND